jgi:hypothetical protein
VVLATGSVVLDARMNGVLGIPFIAFAPFVGVAIGVYYESCGMLYQTSTRLDCHEYAGNSNKYYGSVLSR